MNRTSYLHRQGARPDEEPEAPDESQGSGEEPRTPFAGVAGRFAHWITGMDRVPGSQPEAEEPEEEAETDGDPLRALTAGAAEPAETSRFPLAPLGYSRPAVDQHLAELERELSELDHELVQLRSQREAAPSITEELERIGEQTASILVVAHDKATETTRRAEEQAERCIAEAAANAVALTEGAKRRLQELDAETDAVWRERERLLEDVRAVSTALASLADQASERFPAADTPAGGATQTATAAAPRRAPAAWTPQETERWAVQDTEAWNSQDTGSWNSQATESWAPQDTQAWTPQDAPDWSPQETMPFTAAEEAAARGEHAGPESEQQSGPAAAERLPEVGDTASWLAGFEPPEPDSPEAQQ